MSLYRKAERQRLRQNQKSRKKTGKSSSLTASLSASLTAIFTGSGSKDDCSYGDFHNYKQTDNKDETPGTTLLNTVI